MSPVCDADTLPDSSDIIVVSLNECKTNRSNQWSPNTFSIKSEVRRNRSNRHSGNSRERRSKSRSRSRNRYRNNSGRPVRSRSRTRNRSRHFSGRKDRSRSRSGVRSKNAIVKMDRSRSRSGSLSTKSRSPIKDVKIKTHRYRSHSGSPRTRKRKHSSGNAPYESKMRISSGNKNHHERKRKYSSGSRSSGSKAHDSNDSNMRSKSPALVKDANIALSLEISSIMEKISESKTTENVEIKNDLLTPFSVVSSLVANYSSELEEVSDDDMTLSETCSVDQNKEIIALSEESSIHKHMNQGFSEVLNSGEKCHSLMMKDVVRVMCKNNCHCCGISIDNSGESSHFKGGECKKKRDWLSQGLPLICAYCTEKESHWVTACPLLACFCFSCWAWGHTVKTHTKTGGEEFVLRMLSTYNRFRSNYHANNEKEAADLFPSNSLIEGRWKFDGGPNELEEIALKVMKYQEEPASWLSKDSWFST